MNDLTPQTEHMRPYKSARSQVPHVRCEVVKAGVADGT